MLAIRSWDGQCHMFTQGSHLTTWSVHPLSQAPQRGLFIPLAPSRFPRDLPSPHIRGSRSDPKCRQRANQPLPSTSPQARGACPTYFILNDTVPSPSSSSMPPIPCLLNPVRF